MNLSKINKETRKSISSELKKNAVNFKVKIKPKDFLYASFAKGFFIGTGIQEKNSGKSANLGLFFFDLPAKIGIKRGYYIVRVFPTKSGLAPTGEIVDKNGKVVKTIGVHVDGVSLLPDGVKLESAHYIEDIDHWYVDGYYKGYHFVLLLTEDQ